MSETLLTKCPHCNTTFRLTQAQLQIADGAVRCGACYRVFHANEHIVKTAVVEEIRPAPPAQPDPLEEAFTLDSDQGLDPYDTGDLDLNSADADLFSEDFRTSLEPATSLEDEFGFLDIGSSGKKKGVDESWAEELLKELGDELEDDDGLIHDDAEPKKSLISSSDNAFALDEDFEQQPARRKKKSSDDLSDTFRTLGSFSSDDPFAIVDISEESAEHGDQHDESWAKAILEELEKEEAPPQKPDVLTILKDEPRKEPDHPFAARELAGSREEALKRARAREQQKPKQPKPKATPKDNLRTSETEEFFRLLEEPFAPEQEQPAVGTEPSLQLSDLDDLDDLENDLRDTAPAAPAFKDTDTLVNQQIKLSALRYSDDEPKPRRSGGRGLLFTLGTLLLMVAGLAQYVYFNFDSVARTPQWRPLLEQVCAVLDCRLPTQTNLAAIIGTNLVVRSHPHEPNALVIDVILKNRAPFEQPFPAVYLSFHDTNGTLVAGRRFQPADYIHDPAIDVQRMPPETPIHLTLEIVDPGSRAAGYQIEFLAASSATP